jgi:hypothetical protein
MDNFYVWDICVWYFSFFSDMEYDFMENGMPDDNGHIRHGKVHLSESPCIITVEKLFEELLTGSQIYKLTNIPVNNLVGTTAFVGFAGIVSVISLSRLFRYSVFFLSTEMLVTIHHSNPNCG